MGFPAGADGKSLQPGDPSSIPGSGDPLEKEMATKLVILAWRMWTERPGRLKS